MPATPLCSEIEDDFLVYDRSPAVLEEVFIVLEVDPYFL